MTTSTWLALLETREVRGFSLHIDRSFIHEKRKKFRLLYVHKPHWSPVPVLQESRFQSICEFDTSLGVFFFSRKWQK